MEHLERYHGLIAAYECVQAQPPESTEAARRMLLDTAESALRELLTDVANSLTEADPANTCTADAIRLAVGLSDDVTLARDLIALIHRIQETAPKVEQDLFDEASAHATEVADVQALLRRSGEEVPASILTDLAESDLAAVRTWAEKALRAEGDGVLMSQLPPPPKCIREHCS